MKSAVPALASVLLFCALLPAQDTSRKPHPLAPSLPQLTAEEEERLDRIIDRFIQFDLGQLKGPEGEKALAEFQKLGPEAFFALVRGFNKAAALDGSCPALIIGKKLLAILRSTSDPQLLEFAREAIGAGVGPTRHSGLIRDLRTVVLLRKRDLGRNPAVALAPTPERKLIVIKPRSEREKTLDTMPLDDLLKAIDREKDPARLKELLAALEKRPAAGAVAMLGRLAAAADDSDTRTLAFDHLTRNLTRQPVDTVRELLKDEQPQVRAAAALVAGDRSLRCAAELVGLLADQESEVRQSARKALMQLTGQDFGPEVFSTPAEQAEAVKKWREWLKKSGQ